MDFHLTVMGHRFIEGTMPRIATALDKIVSPLERIAAALEEYNARERAKAQPKAPSPEEGGLPQGPLSTADY
jgi:hypothetical protein